MHDSSIFNIRIDFEKSKASYLYDKNRRQHFLDFFCMYSSSALGYNHPIFDTKAFRVEFNRIAAIKVPNCEIVSDEAQSFLKEFTTHSSMRPFSHFHFCCTGALAIEGTIKTAIQYKKATKPVVISFKESFHGINSYGGFTTDRFFPVSKRLEGMLQIGWPKIHTPKIVYKDNQVDEPATQKSLNRFVDEFKKAIKKYGHNLAGLLVEPIQATYGDSLYPKEFFQVIRKMCTQHDIPLIFDEIQTGMNATGTMWYFEQTGIEPDIVAFGKKACVSGIMVKKKFADIFKTPVKLEVTWDGDLLDMVRCKYILQAYKKYKIAENVKTRGNQLMDGLRKIPQFKNLRGAGLLIAFDFDTEEARNAFSKKTFENKFLFNRTRTHTARMRSNLNVSSKEVDEALAIMAKSVK
jgi:L-lysine 6-transaminase